MPYHMTSSMRSQGACLDNNHTHFILVDDGTINKYGGEISFRASLENCISRKKMEKSCGKIHVTLQGISSFSYVCYVAC